MTEPFRITLEKGNSDTPQQPGHHSLSCLFIGGSEDSHAKRSHIEPAVVTRL